ncbi:hypothetical protein NP233_g10166 [Leucocoprinus birnbaumii]|uniref:DUF6533 domain-containing protein n=1 Tax=Leucocoprinus birnbaumii TaxID=56174 RepID=A0AAD5YLK0_9AGAR|nr:hypothetical protein NP233_g10166 [Leucocoprinus birnbaumii]
MDPLNIELEASHLLAGKYFQLAAFAMLVYDHILTFSQEVDRIWLHRISAATVLFLVNRYGTLIQFIIVVTGLLAVGQLVMILRVYAIYDRNIRVLAFLMVLWAAQIVISIYGLRTGFPAPLSKGLVGCILNGEGPLFPSVWIAPLVTDSVIFFLTINRTKHYLHHLLSPFMSEAAAKALMILVRDGTMYFFVIFMANLLNTLMFFLGPPDIKAIAASFSQLLTCTMLSRLVLNLRAVMSEKDSTTTTTRDDDIRFRNPTFLSRERTRRSLVSLGRQDTSSLWTKALDSLVDETLGAGPTDGLGGVGGIQVTREVVYGDVPMRRMSMKPGMLA